MPRLQRARLAQAALVKFVLEHGAYKLDGPCPACGKSAWSCYPGAWPKCWSCGVIVLRFGRTPSAPSVSPNGRIDGHMKYVSQNKRGALVCSFCRKAH